MVTRRKRTATTLVAIVALGFISYCNNYSLRDYLEGNFGSTNTPAKMYLFYTPGATAGDLRSFTAAPTAREGADGMCAIARSSYSFADNRCNKVRGVVSLSSADTIANLPTNYGVPADRPLFGPNGTTIAENWQQLTTGTLASSLLDAGVAASSMHKFWSFADLTGEYSSTATCDGGTSSLGSFAGQTGDPTLISSSWKTAANQNCNTSAYVLCLCF